MLFQCWWILLSIFLGFTYIVAQVNPPQGHAVMPGAMLPRSDAARNPRAHAAARAQKGQMIVSTADGYIHLIDGTPSYQGQRPSKRWSVSTGAPMISSFQSSTTEMLTFAIIPTVDGSILIHTTDGMRRIPMKAKAIADRTPFVANDGTMYTGSKKTRILGLDIITGRIVQEVSDEGAALIQANLDTSSVLWISRVDYSIRAFSPTGNEQWNVTFSEVLPLTHMLGANRQNSDIARPPSPLVVTPDGELVFSDAHSRSAYSIPLSAPATGAFTFMGSSIAGAVPATWSTGPFTAYPLQIVYKSPRSPAIDGVAHTAVVRSLEENQFFAVVLQPQTTPLIDIDHSTQLSTVVRTEWKSTLPLMTHRNNLPEPRSLLSWLSSPPLDTVSVRDLTEDPSAPQAECITSEHANDNRCLVGVHPIIVDLELEAAYSGMLIDHKPGYSIGNYGDNGGYQYPALPYGPQENPSSLAVDVYQTGIRGLLHNIRILTRGNDTMPENIWWSTLNQGSTAILAAIIVVYILSKPFGATIQAVLAKFGFGSSRTSSELVDQVPLVQEEQEHSDEISKDEPDVDVLTEEDHSQTVGVIEVTNDVLGYGSHGTVVFRGALHHRPVAVKRMLKQFYRSAEREIALLIQSDGHPNVVRYYLKEMRSEFVYLALQLCRMSLRDFVMRLSRELSRKKLRKENPKLKAASMRTVLGQLDTGVKLEPSDVHAPFPARRALQQIAEGLAHLHSLRIVHRDIKPHNILLAAPDDLEEQFTDVAKLEQLGMFTLKISDMGLGKQLDKESSSFASMSVQGTNHTGTMNSASHSTNGALHPMGTIGWQAPELMRGRKFDACQHDEVTEDNNNNSNEREHENGAEDEAVPHRRTQTVDIFSLGCVFYFVLVPGEHPFGEWFDREANIMHNRVNLSTLEHLDDAHDLISKMLRENPLQRPTSAQVCRHPFFWSEERRLLFLVEFSDRLENEEASAPLVLAVETNAIQVVGRSWETKLHPALLEDVARYRKYDTSSVRDCLRVIRNKRHHFHELPSSVKELMSPLPGGFVRYFENLFPKLLMHCVRVACQYLALERDFAPYCFAIAPLYATSAPSMAATIAIDSAPRSPVRSDDEQKTAEVVSPGESKDEHKVEELPEQEDGPPTSPTVSSSLILWSGSALNDAQNCRGWWRSGTTWCSGLDVIRKKSRPAHLQRAADEPKYRTRLCTHWENTGGQGCPMKKKGKCDFAHGPLELRIKENRRNRWGRQRQDVEDGPQNLRLSGGEDSLGAARSIERVRQEEGSLSEFERSTQGGVLEKSPSKPRGSNAASSRKPRGK